jgi:hypothetical protein
MADKYTRPEFAVSRIRYYDGLFWADSDLIEEQNYHAGAQMRHEELLHTAGITDGLDASIKTGGTSIEISAGSAVDSGGRQILLAAPKTIYVDPLWSNGVRFLEMSFNEAETGVADQNSTVSVLTVSGTSTFTADVTLSGTRTLNFDNTSQSKITFTSANKGSDSAFILYKADSSQHGTTSENGRLSLGVFNDFASGNGDALDVQGGYKLKLNAGDWDDELDSAIGPPVNASSAYGISLCVHNSEKMRITSSGITVPSGVAVSGIPVIEMKSKDLSVTDQVGTWYEVGHTFTFSQDVVYAFPMLSSWLVYYTNSKELVRYVGVESWGGTISGKNYSISARLHIRDNTGTYDDPFSGWFRIVAIAQLEYAI